MFYIACVALALTWERRWRAEARRGRASNGRRGSGWRPTFVRVHGLVAGPHPRPALPTGLPALDDLLAAGGLPRGHLAAVAGTAAVALLHRILAEATRAGAAAWVDPLGRLAAAALVAEGADLAALLVSRPPPGPEALRAAAILQAGDGRNAGPFDLLVVDAPDLTAHQAGRLATLARLGPAALVLLDGSASLVAGLRRPRPRRPAQRLAAGRLPAARPDGRGRRRAPARRARRRGGDSRARLRPPAAAAARAGAAAAAAGASGRGAAAMAQASARPPAAPRPACLLLPAWPLQVAARARPDLLARPAAVAADGRVVAASAAGDGRRRAGRPRPGRGARALPGPGPSSPTTRPSPRRPRRAAAAARRRQPASSSRAARASAFLDWGGLRGAGRGELGLARLPGRAPARGAGPGGPVGVADGPFIAAVAARIAAEPGRAGARRRRARARPSWPRSTWAVLPGVRRAAAAPAGARRAHRRRPGPPAGGDAAARLGPDVRAAPPPGARRRRPAAPPARRPGRARGDASPSTRPRRTSTG